MENIIINEIMNNLNEGWVHDDISWRDDFLDTYFRNIFMYPFECINSIHNDAYTYSTIVHYVFDHTFNNNIDIDIGDTVSLFNMYYYIKAKELLIYDNNIQDKIENIKRIQCMRYVVPLVLYRTVYPMGPKIIQYISQSF